MAERVIRQLIDDLDQTEIADGKGGSVDFALRGTNYQIDLNDANIAKLEKALAPFIESATRISGGRRATARAVSTPTRKERATKRSTKRANTKSTAAIRAWAAENRDEVNARGRIPASVVEAYALAHKSGH